MRKTMAAVAAGLLLLATTPVLAAGGCGSFDARTADGPEGGNQSAGIGDQTTTDSTQTATTKSSGN
jgi:hypothetical protein